MSRLALAVALSAACLLQFAFGARAEDRSVYIVELGGYGMLQPNFEGSSRYQIGFKPIFDIHQAGERVWYSSPNDAITYDIVERRNFRAGVAGDISLQSRFHGDNVDFRVGKSDVDVQLGAFAEYYPVDNIRTRIEALKFVTGIDGFMLNLSADYIAKLNPETTFAIGPRVQFVDDGYASELFSTRVAERKKIFVHYSAEGGINSAGLEVAGNYDWTKEITTKVFFDYSRLVGDAADSPRVDVRGAADQVLVGVGASYKFSFQR